METSTDLVPTRPPSSISLDHLKKSPCHRGSTSSRGRSAQTSVIPGSDGSAEGDLNIGAILIPVVTYREQMKKFFLPTVQWYTIQVITVFTIRTDQFISDDMVRYPIPPCDGHTVTSEYYILWV